MAETNSSDAYRGIIIALFIISIWIASLVLSLSVPLSSIHFIVIPVIMLGITFLYTGLFITAHDAMHGTVYPANKTVNNFIGQLALLAFALFPFGPTVKKHHFHHSHPGTEGDPDYDSSEPPRFFRWYLKFFATYFQLPQLIGLAILFNILVHIAGVDELNAILFWAMPPVLSSLQLFYFGTWLPHRRNNIAFHDGHNARSNNYPVFISFLTCYHFGYHWEHHESPATPWWKLAAKRQELMQEELH
jgi:beta-carotene/zeaxanthin 4-ketolase